MRVGNTLNCIRLIFMTLFFNMLTILLKIQEGRYPKNWCWKIAELFRHLQKIKIRLSENIMYTRIYVKYGRLILEFLFLSNISFTSSSPLIVSRKTLSFLLSRSVESVVRKSTRIDFDFPIFTLRS